MSLYDAMKQTKLTFTTLWADAADDEFIFFLFFSRKTDFDISCKLYPTEMSNPISGGKQEKYFKMSSADFSQHAKR